MEWGCAQVLIWQVRMQTPSDLAPGAGIAKSGSALPLSLFSRSGLLFAAAFGLLWLILINELRVDWEVNPQYSYGWVVPVLCLGLLLRRWTDLGNVTTGPHPPTSLLWFFGAGALLLMPLRLGLEAIPGWRSLNWILAGTVVVLTLIAIRWFLGSHVLRRLAFPICFILVAVPWPFSLEVPLIQGLTRANVTATIEMLGWLGVPASQHGNLIEVGAGVVGVDEACSGIRSFQSSIMISLFFGEFYRLRRWPRLFLVPVGFLVAFGLNICRTTILTWLAARNGTEAIAQYHDQAGLTILLAGSATLWAIAWLIHYRSRRLVGEQETQAGLPLAHLPASALSVRYSLRGFWLLPTSLLVWLLAVEIGVELWYHAHETHSANHAEWNLSWPPQEPGFRELVVPQIARELLRYDEGHSGAWKSGDGSHWQMFYFRWFPGRLSVSSARGHNPNVCLTAAGKELRPLDDNRVPISIGTVVLPFSRYEYEQNGQVVHVFHCLWEEHAPGSYFDFDVQSGEIQRRVQAIWHGQRNRGQRAIEIMVVGPEDSQQAQAAVQAQLKKMIRVSAPRTARSKRDSVVKAD